VEQQLSTQFLIRGIIAEITSSAQPVN